MSAPGARKRGKNGWGTHCNVDGGAHDDDRAEDGERGGHGVEEDAFEDRRVDNLHAQDGCDWMVSCRAVVGIIFRD